MIKDTDPLYDPIDEAAFAAKNLYNAANYIGRQKFIAEGEYLNQAAVYHLIKHFGGLQSLAAQGL